jgi:hypothetical protein
LETILKEAMTLASLLLIYPEPIPTQQLVAKVVGYEREFFHTSQLNFGGKEYTSVPWRQVSRSFQALFVDVAYVKSRIFKKLSSSS